MTGPHPPFGSVGNQGTGDPDEAATCSEENQFVGRKKGVRGGGKVGEDEAGRRSQGSQSVQTGPEHTGSES